MCSFKPQKFEPQNNRSLPPNLERVCRYVHYKVLALEEIFMKVFLCNIIGRRLQEILSWKKKLEESILGQKLEENI